MTTALNLPRKKTPWQEATGADGNAYVADGVGRRWHRLYSASEADKMRGGSVGSGQARGGAVPPPPPGFTLDGPSGEQATQAGATPSQGGVPAPPPGFTVDNPALETTRSMSVGPNLSGMPVLGGMLGAMGFNGMPQIDEEFVDPRAAHEAALAKVRETQFPWMNDQQWAEYSSKTFDPYDLTDLTQHGALYGLTDELSAGVGAFGSQVKNWLGDENSPDFGTAYGDYETLERTRRDLGRMEQGWLGTAAEVLGGFASMGRPGMVRGLPLKTGAMGPTSTLLPVVRAPTGGRVSQFLKGSTGAAAQGAAYGFGATDGNVEDRAKGAGAGALFGVGASAAAPVVARGLQRFGQRAAQKAATRAMVKSAPPASAIKAKSKASYDAVDATGAVIGRKPLMNLRLRARTLLQSEGLFLPSGRMVEGYPKLRGAVQALGEYTRGPLDMMRAKQLNRAIRKAVKSTDPEEARLGLMLLDEFDSWMESIPPNAFMRGNGKEAVRQWTNARKDWSRFKRTETIELAIENARYAKDGFAEGLRQQLASIVKSKKRSRGFTRDELAMMRTVAAGAPIEAFLQFLQRGGTLPAYLLGHVSAGPVGGAALAGAKMVGNLGIKGASNAAARRTAARIRAHIATPGGAPGRRLPPMPPTINGVARRIGVAAQNPVLEDQRRWLVGS